MFLQEEGYVMIPVRERGDQENLANDLTTDGMASEALPRV